MAHYLRILSTSSNPIPCSSLQSALDAGGLQAKIEFDDTDSEAWEQIVLTHTDGREIAMIERNLVEDGSLAAEELVEFAEVVTECQPTSAAKWLLDYFPKVECIYALQLLSGTDHKNGWEILGVVREKISGSAPSIIQADNEGFSNEEGYHILWQFSDSVEGDWWMGILQHGQWKHFQMDLGNRKQREAFLLGQIPEGVKFA